jgi:hypothetical protein
VAFGELLKDANRLTEAISNRGAEGSPISVIAVDGETFGHHHRFGDLGLAALIDRFATGEQPQLVAGAALLAEAPPMADATLVAPTSWSCAHGVERWRADCGCRMDPDTRQDWRAPLRLGLETLSAELSAIITRDGGGPGRDPQQAARLRELERHRLAMFTSCAWFFDDLARIEPKIVLRHAARALDLIAPDEAAILEHALVTMLAEAHANDAADGNAARIWEQEIVPGRLAVPRLAAGLLALHVFEREQPITFELPTHTWSLESNYAHLTDLRTGEETRWLGEVITQGVVASRVHLRPAWGGASLVIEAMDFPEVIRVQLATIAAAFVFDATLNTQQRRALDSGELEPAEARRAALVGALEMIYQDDIDLGVAPLLHSALDLYALAGTHLTLEERAIVWQKLAPLAGSAARSRLADRLELVL